MARLSGKVAVITGAAQGMGAAHARLFVREGARVVLSDLNEELGQALATALGESSHFVCSDVASASDWTTLVARTEARFGPVTVLVNNAGILGPVSPTLEFELDDYERIIAINQTGTFLGMKAVLPSMLKAGQGSIVNISSVAGIVASYDTPNLAYIASKYAVRGMTKQIAIEFAERGIRANSVHPGYIKTSMMAAAVDAEQGGTGNDFLKAIPLRRVAEPEEVSNLVLFLASDESSFITGSEHVIDGGATAF